MADLLRVMEREMLCSEHAARCFLEARRRAKARQRAQRSNGGTTARGTPDGMGASAGIADVRPA